MAIGDIIVSIDIGASKISLVVGEVNNFNQIEVVCNISKKSNGIQRGEIVDELALSESISHVVKEAEREMNMKINSSYITIPGKYVTIVQNSVTKEAKDKYSGISSRDVSNALMQTKDIDMPEGKQIIDIIANEFILEDGRVVEDPIGTFSNRFTLNAQVILVDKDYMRAITSIFKKADIDIDGMVPITLAERNLILDFTEKKDYVMLLDVGAETMNLGVFDGNKFVYTNSIPLGGKNITNDLSVVLGVSTDEAEKLKRQYSLALKSYIDNDTDVVLNTCTDDDNKVVKSSQIVEIIEARVEQMFELINQDISKQGIKQSINTVVITGQGITNISKSDVVGKIILNIPVKVANNKIASIIKPNYATAYALVGYIASRPFTKNVSSSLDVDSDEGFFKNLLEKIKEFFYS